MEAAVYSNLNIRVDKKEALAFYYQLRAYIREEDARSFGVLMDLNSSMLKDEVLMGSVLSIMKGKHAGALAQFVHTLEQ
ncbi:hypothetical protein POKO110462_19910 [Pontibacter korlensis]|uniref:Uncharacterized protein n=2 Tax=Pontibacter korlensis TaxID=400092 RepID=A0A0E3UXG7_9BACT|nr:hypothetical protein [Pontibacter korlensis]AKD04247.1 hypothetical protein PKOR_15570 [Pontibacter korlensis]